MRRMIRRQRTLLGRLLRETQRKVALPTTVLREVYAKVLQLLEQTAKRRNTKAKLYSWHAPEVQCINKGKSRQPYEFGAKVGMPPRCRATSLSAPGRSAATPTTATRWPSNWNRPASCCRTPA
jgi:hypothetical protein